MSRSFTAVPRQEYIGQPSPRPLKYGGIEGIGIPLNFNWLSYGASTLNANQAAIVDLRPRQISARLIAIRSIYIDNLGSDTPIYCYFPDTQYSVAAQPNSAGWFKVYSNELIMWVIGLGFLTGDVPSTYILATNLSVENATDIEIQSSIALWKASAIISRGNTIYNTNLGVPALGDQAYQSVLNISNGVFRDHLWNTPYPSGFIYITQLSMLLHSMGATPGLVGTMTLVLESTGISGILYQASIAVTGPAAGTVISAPAYLLGPFNSMNLKLDATQEWRLRAFDITNGFFAGQNFISNFTTNPL